MDLSRGAKDELKRLVADLVAHRYSKVAADGRIGRLTATELEGAIRDYGRKLEALPEESFEEADVFPLDDDPTVCCVDLPLWTTEEGRSDLTLSVTIREVNGGVAVEIDDIHVL